MKTKRVKAFSMAIWATMVLLGSMALPGGAHAFDVDIHGYGDQDFMMSNKNQYLNAAEGTWEHNSMSLIFTANVTDRTSVWAKIFSVSEATTMEWLYVDQKLTGNLEARAGQMKFPIGFYNLIRDNKFLHVTELEPAMYSMDIDMIFENFRGVGLEFTGPVGIEIFGGAPESEEMEEGGEQTIDTVANTITTVEEETETKNLVGGRLTLKTPLEGLQLMASGTVFDEEETVTTTVVDLAGGTVTQTEDPKKGDEKLWILTLDYDNHDIVLRAEYARKNGIDEKIISYYGELGYTIANAVMPYVRYDVILTDIDNKGDPANHQKDTVVGFSYKFNEYLKFKAENHFIEGFAIPVITGEVDPASPDTARRWNLFVAGVNFIF